MCYFCTPYLYIFIVEMYSRTRNIIAVTVILLLSLAALPVQARGDKTGVFIFGVSTSFNDSTVYFTEIQQLDSAVVTKRGLFLYGRDQYSYQLKSYMQGLNVVTPTCLVMFASTRNKIEKKYVKLRKRFQNTKKGLYDLKYIDANAFRFITIRPEK